MSNDAQSDALRRGREQVFVDWPEIVRTLCEQAKKGSYQHAKFLYDFAFTAPAKRVAHDKDQEDEELPGPSLADLVMERLNEFLVTEADAPPTMDADA